MQTLILTEFEMRYGLRLFKCLPFILMPILCPLVNRVRATVSHCLVIMFLRSFYWQFWTCLNVIGRSTRQILKIFSCNCFSPVVYFPLYTEEKTKYQQTVILSSFFLFSLLHESIHLNVVEIWVRRKEGYYKWRVLFLVGN